MFHCKHASWLQCFLTPIIAETYRCFSFSRACFSGFQPLVLGGVTLPSEVGWVKRKRWNFETSYRLDFFTGQPVSAEIFRQTKARFGGLNQQKKVMFHLQQKLGQRCVDFDDFLQTG